MIRKIILPALSLSLLTAFASHAAEPSKYDLHKCVVSENCSVIESTCSGEFEAVNLRYENKLRAAIKEKRKSARCAKSTFVKTPSASCIQNQCTLNVKK